MAYKTCSEITPSQAKNPDCPFNCIGCEYFRGLQYCFNGDVEIECDLEDNDDR